MGTDSTIVRWTCQICSVEIAQVKNKVRKYCAGCSKDLKRKRQAEYSRNRRKEISEARQEEKREMLARLEAVRFPPRLHFRENPDVPRTFEALIIRGQQHVIIPVSADDVVRLENELRGLLRRYGR